MLSLTPRARERLLAHARAGGARGYGLKIVVVAGGCAGFSYDLHLVAGPAETDATFGDGEMPIYVDPRTLRLLDGLQIDYDRGFRFTNPRATAVCSCGSSFAL